MSLNRNTTTYTVLINVLITIAVCLTLWLTKNPLALLGIFFMQELPLFQDQPTIDDLRQMGLIDDSDDEDQDGDPRSRKATAPGDDYADTKTGFTGRLRKAA